MDYDHRIHWNNVKILKSETRASRRRVAKSFLMNQKASSLNAINCENGVNFSLVNRMFTAYK